MARPDPAAYREALVASREALLQSRGDIALRIRRELQGYVSFLRRELEREGIDRATRRALQRAVQINEAAAANLLNELVNATETGRGAIFEQTLSVWESSGLEAARSLGIADATLASVRAPPVSMLAQFESVGAAHNWRTLLRGHVANAATEANAIVRGAIVEGVDRDELARRMRRYVVGSEPFDDVFTKVPTATGEVDKIDLRRLSASERGAARQMEFNARRIASSELRNASHEATVQHMIRDPLIIGVEWTLAITHVDADECDVLASADWYGLGPGVHRVDSVPAPPHAFDACSNMSVARPASEIGRPKPTPDRRVFSDSDITQEVSALRGVSREKAARITNRARTAVGEGERRIQGALQRAAA